MGVTVGVSVMVAVGVCVAVWVAVAVAVGFAVAVAVAVSVGVALAEGLAVKVGVAVAARRNVRLHPVRIHSSPRPVVINAKVRFLISNPTPSGLNPHEFLALSNRCIGNSG